MEAELEPSVVHEVRDAIPQALELLVASDELPDDLAANAVNVEVEPGFDLGRLRRHFYTSSSCGVCGKGAIEAVQVWAPRVESGLEVSESVVASLPERLREAAPGRRAPHAGERWRVNFSRVEWHTDIVDGRYVKRTNAETKKPLPETPRSVLLEVCCSRPCCDTNRREFAIKPPAL